MPELPEVETVLRGLEPVMIGQRFLTVKPRRMTLRFPLPDDFAGRLEGATVSHLTRRAKYLQVSLSTGWVLVMHLGMSGRFLVRIGTGECGHTLGGYIYDTGANEKHDHVVFVMSGGHQVVYNDPRRFGFMLLIKDSDLATHALFRNLGVEPLGNCLTADYLAASALRRRSNLKSFLMDQRIVAGLGNIYVCEALHQAGLSPNRSVSCLIRSSGGPTRRAEQLVAAIRHVLTAAIDVGGSTLRDYRHPDGESGGFQDCFQVYNREGQACVRIPCRGRVKRVIQSGRSTFYCGGCQR